MILEKVTRASIGAVLDSRIFDLAEMDDRPDLVEQMSRPLRDIPPYGGEYGLGIWTATFGCDTALGHSGDVPATPSRCGLLQGLKRSVVVVVTGGGPVGHAIADTTLCW
jgi:hypothetical protein